MTDETHSPAQRGLLVVVTLVCLVLIAFPVVDALLNNNPRVGRITVFSALTFIAFVVGVYLLHRRSAAHDRPAETLQWEPFAVLAVVATLWAMVIVDTPNATYFLIALYLVAAWLLPPVAGGLTTAVLASFTVAGQIVHHGWSPGAVMGPLVAAILVLGFMTVLRMVLRDSDTNRRLLLELRQTQAALSASEREAGRLSERTRLGRDLHDTVAQSLSSIQLLLHASERAEPEEALALTQQARAAAHASLEETRSFIRDLTPPDLRGRSLTSALERVVERVKQQGVDVQFIVTGGARSLPTPTEATLLRIAQEALANVVAHARAATCTVTLEFETNEVLLEVDDDGAGFDAEATLQTSNRFGLAGIRARATELGGSAAFVSSPGDGTLVAVRLPVPEPASVPSPAVGDPAS